MASPVTSFLSQDFESLIEDVTQFAMATFPAEVWTDFNDSQVGTYLLRVEAYIGDLLGYQLNASVMETILMRVVRERNLRLIAQSVNYEMRSATGASTTLRISGLPTPPDPAYPFVISSHHQFQVKGITFQPLVDKTVTSGSVLFDVTDGYYVEIDVREGAEVFEETLGLSSGGPIQQFQLSQYPVQDGTLVVTVTADGGYTPVRSFTFSSSSDTHYRTYSDEEGRVTVEFGNGVTGKIPTLGQTIRATYRVTSVASASDGNVPAGILTWTASGSTSGGDPVPSVVQTASIRNTVRATGGGPKETLENARRAIPGYNRTNDRAVYIDDYGDLAALVAGVAHAKSFASRPVLGMTPIQVRIVPTGGGAPSPPLVDAVAAYLSTRKDPGRHVFIQGADYVGIKISVDAFLEPTARRQTVRGYVEKTLTGLFDPDGMEYASVFPLQAVYDALEPARIPGLKRVYISEFRVEAGWAEYPTLPTVGDGGVVYMTTSDAAVTREWNVRFTYPTPPSTAPEYQVFERVLGHATSVSSTTVTDDASYFPPESLVGWSIVPVPASGNLQSFPVTVNTDRRLETSTPGLSSYLSVGDEFAVERFVSSGKVVRSVATSAVTSDNVVVNSTANWNVGDQVVVMPAGGDPVRAQVVAVVSGTVLRLSKSVTVAVGDELYYVWADPNARVEFAVRAGASPWTVGDQLHVDSYARVADLTLRASEFPTLDPVDMRVNIIGGIA